MIGRRVSHFDIVEELGRGGMGVVYKGRDTRLHRFVALKFLSGSLSDDPSARSRFLLEARAAAALEHVNVCSIFEISDSEAQAPYIVMAFCDGLSLRDILASRRLEMGEVAAYARQIAAGLAHAHRNRVIHRDLKPGNVIVTGDDVVKIVDFGIANLIDATTVLREDGQVGTPAYMSPEQLSGDPADHRLDIWSYGVLLYEMIAGRNPFVGSYDQATIYNVLNVDPPLISDTRSDVGSDWESIVRKCLEKDPSHRYVSFESVLGDLPSDSTGALSKAHAPSFAGYLPNVSGRAFVGRDEEGARLRARLSEGSGSTTLIFGESGIGKTQFVSRNLSERLSQTGHALWGRCLYNEGALPYHPFVSALKKGFADDADITAQIEAMAIEKGVEFRGRRSLLRAFLSVGENTEQVLNREQLWHTMLLVYGLLSDDDSPLYLVVDDLQWADPASIALFCYLARSIEGANIHLIGLYRLEAPAGRGGASIDLLTESLRQLRIEGLAEQIDLGRFGRADSDALVDRMLDGDPADDDLKDHLYEQSDGLPLFLAESLNLLRLEGGIAKIDGMWRLSSTKARQAAVSGRIQDVILQRLDVLDEEDRELLEVAAVEGEHFTSESLEACLGWKRIRVLKRLQLIEKKHQLVMHESGGYRFDHTMVRQVLYDGTLPELRQEYHRLIAAALESSEDQRDDQAAMIARHLVASGQELKAVPFLLRAANRARSVHATEQALDLYRELDRIRGKLELDDPDLGRAVARGLGDASYALGDVQSATEHFSLYLDLARSVGHLSAELEARRKLAESLRITGHLDEALDLIDRTLDLARSSGAQDETLKALQTYAEIWASRGEYERSVEYASEALELAAGRDDRSNRSIAESILGFAYWHMGSLQRSQEHFSRALDTQRSIGDRLGMATTLNFLALSLWKLGRFEQALRCARESVDVKRRISLLRAVPGSMNIIGDVYRDAFSLDQAVEVHEQSLELATAHDNKGGMCDNLRDLGADHLEKGDLATAEDYMRRALALAESSGIKWYETRSSIGLAEVLLRSGSRDEAQRFAERGLALAKEINARELLIEAKWVMALVLDDEPEEQRALLEEAGADADRLELLTLSWRIRADLAVLCQSAGNTADESRLRSEAWQLVNTIADRIEDADLKARFLSSDRVARLRPA